MRTVSYTTTKTFRDSIGEGHSISVEAPTTLAEALSSGFFPSEEVLVAKAVAQHMISAVHRASAWAEKEEKSRKEKGAASVTPAEVEAKVREFRYGAALRERGEAGASKTSTKELRAKAKQLDATKAALVAKIVEGRFSPTAVGALLETGAIEADEIRAAFGETPVPEKIAALLA